MFQSIGIKIQPINKHISTTKNEKIDWNLLLKGEFKNSFNEKLQPGFKQIENKKIILN